MKIRKKLVILFLLSQMLCQFLIISSLFSTNEFHPVYNIPDINILFPFQSKSIPSSQYENFFSNYNWKFDSDYAPLQILTVIHYDETSNIDDFAYLSAIPIAIFNDSGIRKLSPIIYDNVIGHENTQEFLREWKAYNDLFGGLKRVIYIGDVSTQTRNEIEDIFGTQGEVGAPIDFSGDNIFDLSAQISDFFWYSSSKAVLVLGNDTFNEPESIYSYSINNNISPNTYFSKIENITNSNLEDIYTINNVTLDGGAIFASINDTNNKLAMDLIGNYSESNKWVFDTDNSTNNNFIFFPNVTYPANLSDWAIRIYNTSLISSDVVYNITFCNFSAYYNQIQVNYSNTELKIEINWTDSQKDIDLWLLNPEGQLIESSDRNGYLYENGETDETIAVDYPSIGNWTLIVTANENQTSIPFTLEISFLNHSDYKARCIESASNGAVIASLLHLPMFFTNGNSLSTYTQKTLSELGLSEVIVVEPGNTINETLVNELGISTVTLENISIICEYIQNISYQNDFTVTSLKDGFFAPASLISAYHGGIVLPFFNESYNFYMQALSNYKLMEYSYFQSPLAGPGPIFEDMTQLSDIFHNWMDNIDAGGINRTIITVSPLSDLYPSFERAIIGRSFPGRFSAENELDDAIFMCRSIFYRALNFKEITNDNKTTYRLYQRNEFWADISGSINSINKKGDWVTFNDTYVKKIDIYSDYCSSSESGYILRPYAINLTDHGISYENVTNIDIQMVAKIGYANSSIQSAGLKIWNWTALNYTVIDSTVFNSTIFKRGRISITESNKSHFISSDTNSTRIELFFYVNTTANSVTASVNLVQFNISFWTLFAKKNILSSSISYWHNFTFGAQTYNYTEDIATQLSNSDYIVNYSTSFSNISNFLKNEVALWYLCGIGDFSGDPFNDNGSIKLMINDYWRGFNNGQTPEDPIGAQNPVDPSDVAVSWMTGTDISNALLNESLNLTHIILNNDFLGSTRMPNILLGHGASTIVANLRNNMLGYSEHLFYTYVQELMKNKTISIALNEALNRTSHLYSKHWRGNIVESPPFPNNTEDYHQFIIFGDPESHLINSTSLLLLPGNYKPIVHKITNHSVRKGIYEEEDLFNSPLYANITDIDSKVNSSIFIAFDTDISSDSLDKKAEYTSYLDNGYLYNFLKPVQFSREAVVYPNTIFCYWKINDTIDEVVITDIISLTSNPPIFIQDTYTPYTFVRSHFYIDYGNGTVDEIKFSESKSIGRVNETLNVSLYIMDTDHNNNTGDDATEFKVTLHLKHKSSDTWVNNLTMQLSKSIEDLGEPSRYGISEWNTSYIFTDDDPIGEYEFFVSIIDGNNESVFRYVNFSVRDPEVINWPAEYVSFVNNTNSLFRVNETLHINATFFDRDDYLDENFLPYKENDSIILNCEGNDTITNIGINGSYFENDYQATFIDDNFSHTIINDSQGIIRMPYSINLSNAAIEYNNITEIEIKLKATLNNTSNTTFAGWEIYNWTSSSLYTLSNDIFNSTNWTIGKCYISNNNLSHFVNPTNNRIEIFFYLETNTTTNASIDYIAFNVTYPVNKTGISAEIQMNHGGDWINRPMTYDKIREIWQFDWVFSPENDSGVYDIYFNLTDKENDSRVWNTNKNITVKNHAPNWVISNISTNSTYRAVPIQFFGNATDIDTFNRSEDLTLIACLYHIPSDVWDNSTYLIYNNYTNGWNITLSLNSSFFLGNWSFLVSVTDGDGGYNETNMTYFQVLNNLPVIIVTQFIPSDHRLYDGESIQVWCNVSDIEFLNRCIFQLNDSSGHMSQKIKFFPPLSLQNATVSMAFSKRDYRTLEFRGSWKLYVLLYDNDGGITNVTQHISLRMPPLLPPPPPFQWEYLIIAGLIVSVVLGTILVYRFYKREQVVVPASRVKAIIKKMIEEKEVAELEEEKLIKERKIKEKLKKKPTRKIKEAKPVTKEKFEGKKEKLDKLEIKNLEVRLSETLNSARQAIRKKNYNYAAELYQRAAKISSQLGDIDKAKRFSERAEELFKRGKK